MTDAAAPPQPAEPRPRWTDYLPLDAVEPALRNAKRHDLEAIAASYERFGYVEAITLDERTGRLVAGHGRIASLLGRRIRGEGPPEGVLVEEGRWLVPVGRGWASADDDEARAYLIASNRITEAGGWDVRELAEEAVALQEGPGLAGTGIGDDELAQLLASLEDQPGGEGGAGGAGPNAPTLADRFLVPPFSTLDARAGYWQERKRAWLGLGIRSEEGRAHNLLKMSDTVLEAQRPNRSTPASHSGNDPQYYWKKQEAERQAGRELTNAEFEADWFTADAYEGGTSIFDPVLCEIAYRWFCPPTGRVLDPFAGGSVRGITAAWLGRSYSGVELRPEQVASNRDQADAILATSPGEVGSTTWTEGDSALVLAEPSWEPEPFDLLFSCPPYFDLEVYSDEPGDLSNAGSYEEFLVGYRQIIRQAVSRLADDRFAVWVIGDVRAPDGTIRGLIPDTIAAFREAGAAFYNEAALITPVGSLALRAARIFTPARKLGRSHQSVLVFIKGDAKRAAQAAGPVEMADPAELFGTLLQEGVITEGEALERLGFGEEPQPEESPGAPTEDGAPAWAKGRSVEQLQQVSAFWRAHDGDLPLSIFTAMRETDVAAAADRGTLHLLGTDGAPVAGFVGAPSKAKAQVLDFRGQPVATIARGDFVVRRLACAPGYEWALVELLREHAGSARLWVNAWQEHPTDRAVVEALGLALHGTKVRASSELIGVYGPPPGAQLPRVDGLGLAQLPSLAFDPEPLAAEVAAAEVGWADHYASYNQRHSWAAVALRGYGGRVDFIVKPAEMSKGWKAEHAEELGWGLETTPLAEALPACWDLALSVAPEEQLHRVRLMRLAPNDGELTRHADITDPDAGTQPGQLLRLHFPIETNEQVRFRQWLPTGGQVSAHMAAGEAWSLDTRLPHTARNDGATERVHLVIDVESSPDLLARFGDQAPLDAWLVLPELADPPGPVEPWPL